MKLIPQPQRMSPAEGTFRLRYDHRITLDASCDSRCRTAAAILQQEVLERTGLTLSLDRRQEAGHPGIRLSLCPELGTEHYVLDVSREGVFILGGDYEGLLHGVQTLRQILRQEGPVLPCMQVEDWPAIPVRGLFYDATRCRIPTLASLKALADRISFYKMNQLHLYVEHTFLFDGLSEVWRDDTPLTAEDILELDAYCLERGVELVPSVVSLGHMYKILRTRSFHHLSEIEEEPGTEFSFINRMRHHVLDTTNEESFRLVCDLIDQFLPLFTSKKFNINGDESFDLGKGRGKARADEVGSHRMYVDWICRVANYLKEKGRQTMFWGDIILAQPETLKELPEDIICMNWDYGTQKADHAAKLHAVGANQYLCPGAQGWHQTVNRFGVAYINCRNMAELCYENEGIGLLMTEWGDYGHFQDPESSNVGIIYAGAMGWNRNIPSEDELNEAIARVEYLDRTCESVKQLRLLQDHIALNWGMAVEFTEVLRGRLDRTIPELWEDFLRHIGTHMDCIAEDNAAIDAIMERVAESMKDMDPEGRKRMKPYFLMADAQKLLNRFSAVLDERTRGRKNPMTVDTWALAEDFETWFRFYREQWRATSREAELARVTDVVLWIADYLRNA